MALAWPPLVSAALLILTLVLLLFTGQTVIFLLRLVAADKRGRRTPRSATARKTVGMLEDEWRARRGAPEPLRTDAPSRIRSGRRDVRRADADQQRVEGQEDATCNPSG